MSAASIAPSLLVVDAGAEAREEALREAIYAFAGRAWVRPDDAPHALPDLLTALAAYSADCGNHQEARTLRDVAETAGELLRQQANKSDDDDDDGGSGHKVDDPDDGEYGDADELDCNGGIDTSPKGDFDVSSALYWAEEGLEEYVSEEQEIREASRLASLINCARRLRIEDLRRFAAEHPLTAQLSLGLDVGALAMEGACPT